jgi:beta-phosphoglucomutase
MMNPMNPNTKRWLSDVLAVPFKSTKHIHSHQDEVYRIETQSAHFYLKISRSLKAERDNLQKLDTVLHVPKVIDFYDAGENDYLLLSELPGKNLVELIGALPETAIVRMFAEAIRKLHSVDATKVFPEASPQDVLLHGDMALPNIIANQGDIGYIDFGQLHFGTPELDVADALWSLQRNLGPAYGNLFLESYGSVVMTPKIQKALTYRHTTTIPTDRVKAVIFDMDGTMINNMPYHKKAWQVFLQKHGISLTEEAFHHKISGKKNDQIFELVFGRRLHKDEELQYTEEKEALYRELFKPDIAEIAGLTELINQLHAKGVKTAIATTAPAKNRQFALKELGLEGKFEVILGDEHVRHGKPDPEIYLLTAQKLGVKPHDCLVFEDSPPGIASGKAAGMTVVGILSSHKADELHNADYTVKDFTQVSLA